MEKGERPRRSNSTSRWANNLMKLRSTTRVRTTLIEYMTFLFLVLFFVVVFIPGVRSWVIENLLQLGAVR